MSRRKKSVIPGFSLNRALGITSAKQKFARATGIPTTKQGRKRKMQSHLWTAAAVGVAAACSQNKPHPQSTEESEQIAKTVASHRNIRQKVIFVAIALCAGLLVILKIKSLLF